MPTPGRPAGYLLPDPGPAGVWFAGLSILLGLYLTSRYNFLLFHSLVEVIGVVVGCSIFLLGWNARHFLDNDYLLFVAIGFLFVAFLDLLHALAYKGMGVFAGDDPNLPTQLWIADRYLQGAVLLGAPFFLKRRLGAYWALAAFAVLTGLLLASIFHWGVFPDCYVDGIGLTAFKRISEYVVVLLLLAATLLLVQRHREFDPWVLRLLVASLIVAIVAELAFTLYIDVTDTALVVGHFLRLISIYLIYKAIVETGLRTPYHLLFRDLKQSEKALQTQAVELQSRNEELDAYARTVAHNLKNPLAAIISAASLLERGILLDQESEEVRLEIIDTAFKMNSIINELLLLAEIRKGEVPALLLDMAAIEDRARTRLSYTIKKCGGEVLLPPDWPAVIGYGPWVEEVWINYMSNALKYGGRPPRVELGADRQEDGMVRFWVRDNGPGITPAEQARLFQPFTQLRHDRASGHGLGLSIVRQIVEKLGGQVGVESAVGRGSTFFFTLPAPGDQPMDDEGHWLDTGRGSRIE